jgi:asparagine synthase (glutamine-hydrolysing)
MCGIAGILGRPDGEAMQRMLDAMARRGPDDCGVYQDARIILGHRRLSIIDVTSAGHQPMSSAGGKLWIVYNGEIYNHAVLREEMARSGRRFASRSDTEVILALYEERGVDCVARLEGMFAFAIWDLRGPDPLLVLARDHFGIKPLLYASTPHGFIFASDIPGIAASGLVETTLDPVGLVQYLMHGHVVQPRTILRGVEMLPAAHVLTMRPGEVPRLKRYWRLDYERSVALSRGLKEPERVERVRLLLERAARAQMVGDVPVGAFLSGGVDSSTIVALMSRASGQPIHTYSVGFPDVQTALDESGDARESARFLGAVHREVQVGAAEVAGSLPAIAADLGQPTVDGVNMHFVSRAARSGVTVALAGIGGDELFGGYGTFPNLARHATLREMWRRRAMLARWAAVRMMGRSGRMQDAWESLWERGSFIAAYMSQRMVRAPDEAWRVAGCPEIDARALFGYADGDDAAIADPISRVSLLESSLYMRSQLLRDADAASMAHSLEVRVPFLDVALAEFVFGLPGDSKLGEPMKGARIIGKRILIQAVGDLIPDWTWRKPKRGFTLPFGEWLRGPLRPLVEDALGDSAFRTSGWIDAGAVDREWRSFLQNPAGHWSRVWTVLMLALWERELLRHVTKRRAGTAIRSADSAPANRPVASTRRQRAITRSRRPPQNDILKFDRARGRLV